MLHESDLLARTTMVTASGRIFSLSNPRPEDVDIGDIAAALSKLCRFNGAVRSFYSVAQHCIYAAENCPADPLGALLHDATEAYVGDMIRPLKLLLRNVAQDVGSVFDDVEDGVWKAIATKFGINPDLHPSVKDIDNRMCATEQMQLMTMPDGWTTHVEPLPIHITPWHHERACRVYLSVFDDLMREHLMREHQRSVATATAALTATPAVFSGSEYRS